MKVAQTTTPGPEAAQVTASSDNDPVIPRRPIPGPRKPSDLTVRLTDEVRACDWNGHTPDAPRAPIPHDLPVVPGSPDAKLQAAIDAWDARIPTAAPAPVHLTRAQLDREIAAAQLHEPYLIGYSGTQAHAAFGGAA